MQSVPITTKVVNFNPAHGEGVLDTTLCDKACQWLTTGQWFSPGPPISPTNKTDRHDITEILFNTITLTQHFHPNFQEISTTIVLQFILVNTSVHTYCFMISSAFKEFCSLLKLFSSFWSFSWYICFWHRLSIN